MAETTATFDVVMPRLGLTMTEAKITAWLKPEGAWVEKGEPLFVLEHEKASLEIESPASGRLNILVPVEQVVPILTPIAVLDCTGEATVPNVERVRATPKARRLARAQGIPLQGLAGSGMRGMVTAADLQALFKARPGVKASPLAQKVAQEMGVELTSVAGSGPRGQVMRRDVEKAVSAPARPAASSELDALPGLRGIIARRLSASWAERPQVTLTTEADATSLVALRQQVEAEWNVKISYNAFLIKLVAWALREYPYINAQLTASGIQLLPDIHIGLAVDTERGLLVPVLHDADRKSFFEIQDELGSLTQRALEGRSLPDDLTGGTFTITNLGVYEIDAFTPVINPPECAILGVGRIVPRPVGLNGQIVLRDMMALSLSFDHRLVDGAPAARFLQRVKTLIERCFLIGIEK
jgi:pyruvate dehydrogenase E2 component (dihydrolipoamide acetyltransferase)